MFQRSAAGSTLVLSPTGDLTSTHASPSPEEALSAYATLHSPFASSVPANHHHHNHNHPHPDSAHSDPASHAHLPTPEEAPTPQQSPATHQHETHHNQHQHQHRHLHLHHLHEDQDRVSSESLRSEISRSPQVHFPSEALIRRDSPSFSALDSPRTGTVVTLLLHCCHVVVTLLLHGCYIVVILLLHCCDTVATL
jgi:hypothetical protein